MNDTQHNMNDTQHMNDTQKKNKKQKTKTKNTYSQNLLLLHKFEQSSD